MTFSESVKTCFSKFAEFQGRAPRSEFWWFFLLDFLLGMLPGIGSIIGWCCLYLPFPWAAAACTTAACPAGGRLCPTGWGLAGSC